MKLVKVGRVGRKIIQVCLPDCSTVNSALIAAGMQPFSNEDIWVNHQIVSSTAGLVGGETVILEERTITPAMLNFIDALIDENFLDPCDYEDEDGDTDYNQIYSEMKIAINNLVEKARRV